ncbi:ankyrin repeat domain-containing protein, partial [Bacteroidota bacterium]
PEIARLLIDKGADVNSLNNRGITPLYYAISSGSNRSDDIAMVLIENGANVNAKSPRGETLLQIAVSNGFTNVARLMIEKRADKSVLVKNSYQSLLHLAAINGYADMAEMLIKKGLDPNQKDYHGKSPKYYAGLYGNSTVVKELLKAGVNKGKLTENYNPSPYLDKKLKKDQAYIWYMKNRGWSIKTNENLFVFDNEERGRRPDIPSLHNGFISDSEIADQNVIALYSGYHAVPGSMEFIHGMEESIKNITYLNYKDDRWRGGNKTFYLKGREKKQIGNVEIRTLETHQSYGMGSIGYLIKTEGLTIYYGCFPTELIDEYKKEIDYIAEFVKKCDMAFLQFATGKEEECINYVIDKINPAVVFPITMGDNRFNHKEMAHRINMKFPDVQAIAPVIPGEMYEYKNGKIK